MNKLQFVSLEVVEFMLQFQIRFHKASIDDLHFIVCIWHHQLTKFEIASILFQRNGNMFPLAINHRCSSCASKCFHNKINNYEVALCSGFINEIELFECVLCIDGF